MNISDVLQLKQIAFLSPLLQILLISLLFIVTVLTQFEAYNKTGKTWGHYPLSTSSFFAAIYEEILFRGLILVGLLQIYTETTAIIISSLLFGLWHFKNIFYLSKKELVYQMLYTGLIFGPIMAIITLATDTIWLAVILHFANNLLAFEINRKRR